MYFNYFTFIEFLPTYKNNLNDYLLLCYKIGVLHYEIVFLKRNNFHQLIYKCINIDLYDNTDIVIFVKYKSSSKCFISLNVDY
jgi:hypothetical protein